LPIWAKHGITLWPIRNFDGCYLFSRTEAELTLRCHRIGPEKGVIHIATGAVDNALWDLYARARQKPLWKLIVDMSPVCLRTARYSSYGRLINVLRRSWSSRPRSDILLMRSRLMRRLLSSRQEKRRRRSARPSCVHKGEMTLRYCLPACLLH
jgi:L-alanine-DL-glutamate epimerase-like enolase superfamily enzyme